jgi:UDP-N-acetylmuramyl tripeptide synthase
MRHQVSTLIGKSVRLAARVRGGGSALPGLVVERIDPQFMARVLSDLSHGVVVVSGTNGKTTTTKMVVELLESQGLRVFTNRTGSNFTRGVAAALLEQINIRGRLAADIAVLELDEAHAVHFVHQVAPRYSLFLNVMRDQLDRFGEIDHTAELLHRVAKATSDTVVVNRDDPRLVSPTFLDELSANIVTYGVSEELISRFPSDDSLRASTATDVIPSLRNRDVELYRVKDDTISLLYDDTLHDVNMNLKGIYNMQNAAGAVALVRAVMGKSVQNDTILGALSQVTPAFGRGEAITIDNTSCELVLVKNPSGFRLSLSSFDATDHATMIAINDDYADGRDMSWLWDVDFNSLDSVEMVSGVRAYDMALRLAYDEVAVDTVDTDLTRALDHFLSTHSSNSKRIFCTYTAMLAIRKALSNYGEVKRVL